MSENNADLETIVEQLGSTADEVALNLQRAGITGKRGEPDCCPVANYLSGIGFVGALVQLHHEEYLEISTPDEAADASKAVEDFVASFDGGAYPFLVTDGAA